jgi:glycosyltransferase involved in cell wall biosynthesis
MPLVSVVLPTKNRADLLGRSIKSVLSQTFRDLELIIVDDGSTDNTAEIVKSFKDDRIIYDRLRENKGAGAARNRGIALSKGKFIAFQDDDDEWRQGKLDKEVKVFEENADPDLGVVFTNMWVIGEKVSEVSRPALLRPADGFVFNDALFGRLKNIGIQTALIRREVFDKVGGFDESFPRWIDHEFFIRASRYFLFYHIDEPLVNWYAATSGIASVKINKFVAMKMLLAKYAEDYNKPENKMLLSGFYYDLGHGLCSLGELSEGRKYLLKSIKLNPAYVKAWIAVVFSLTHPSIYKVGHPL